MMKLALLIGRIYLYNTKMSQSTNEKRERGRPKGTGTGVTPITGVRLADDIGEAIDKFAAGEGDRPSRSEAIRRILRDWLSTKGYLSD